MNRATRHASPVATLLLAAVMASASPPLEVVVAINADRGARQVNVPVAGTSRRWEALQGHCEPSSPAAGSYALAVPGLDFAVCRARAAE